MSKRITLTVIGTAMIAAVTANIALADRGDHRRTEGGESRMERHHSGDKGRRGGRHMGREMGRGGAMMQIMETFDTNGDGTLTQDELDAARAAQLTEFDADGDGSLNLEEYQGLWLSVMRERMVDQFQNHDDDGDGIVTTEEFGERFDGFVARADRNDDGVLNADDFGRARRGGPRGGAPEAGAEAEDDTPAE